MAVGSRLGTHNGKVTTQTNDPSRPWGGLRWLSAPDTIFRWGISAGETAAGASDHWILYEALHLLADLQVPPAKLEPNEKCYGATLMKGKLLGGESIYL